MIRRELRFITPSVSNERARHDCGVVDQKVERTPRCQESSRECIDGGRIEKIKGRSFKWKTGEVGSSLLLRPHRDNHSGSSRNKSFRRLEAESDITPGDDGNLSSQIDALPVDPTS
jgi:hypothetical protein